MMPNQLPWSIRGGKETTGGLRGFTVKLSHFVFLPQTAKGSGDSVWLERGIENPGLVACTLEDVLLVRRNELKLSIYGVYRRKRLVSFGFSLIDSNRPGTWKEEKRPSTRFDNEGENSPLRRPGY